jgi:hypothetical protein
MIDLLELVPFFVWRYNGAMQIVNFPETANNQVGASGHCPHCTVLSYFRPVATATEFSGQWQKVISAAQCQVCQVDNSEYIFCKHVILTLCHQLS